MFTSLNCNCYFILLFLPLKMKRTHHRHITTIILIILFLLLFNWIFFFFFFFYNMHTHTQCFWWWWVVLFFGRVTKSSWKLWLYGVVYGFILCVLIWTKETIKIVIINYVQKNKEKKGWKLNGVKSSFLFYFYLIE